MEAMYITDYMWVSKWWENFWVNNPLKRDSSLNNLNYFILYSPSCRSKHVCPSLFSGTQNKIFWRMLVTSLDVSVPVDFHYMHKQMQWKSMGTKTVWSPGFFKITYFVLNRRKNSIQGWNNMRVSKLWQFEFLGGLSHLKDCSQKNLILYHLLILMPSQMYMAFILLFLFNVYLTLQHTAICTYIWINSKVVVASTWRLMLCT